MNSSRTFRPFIQQNICIDSLFTYKKFIFKGYKSPKLLNFEGSLSVRGALTTFKKMRKVLVNIFKRCKTIQGLRLHKYLLNYSSLKKPYLHNLLKHITNLRSLSLSFYGDTRKLLRVYAKWLRHSKRLKRFHFLIEERGSRHIFAGKSDAPSTEFFRALKLTRLETVSFHIEANSDNHNLKQLLFFHNYPLTLQSLYIHWKSNKVPLFTLPLPKEESCLEHLKKLKSLDLIVPGSVLAIQPIITSISNLSNMICLSTNLYNPNHSARNNINWFQGMLREVKHLSSMSLTIDPWPVNMKDFIESIKRCPLRRISLDITLQEDSNLTLLGNLLSGLPLLETLSMKINKDTAYEEEECYFSFFKSISQLKSLKRLKLYFSVRLKDEWYNSLLFPSAFKDCLNDLNTLEELSFRLPQTDFGEQATSLIQVLKAKAPSLKKLRMDFGGLRLDEYDLEQIALVIKEAKALVVLHFYEITFEETILFEIFVNSLCFLKNLEVLKMIRIKGNLNKKVFTLSIKRLLSKRGLKKLNCTQAWGKRSILHREIIDHDRINLEEILAQNPHLKTLYVPFDIYIGNNHVYKWH